MYDEIVKILDEIHSIWVLQNAKKYDRDDKKLYQHLPTALIGVDELAKDFMFLAPFLKERGIEVGEMQQEAYGAFVPNDKLKAAYARFVETYKADQKVANVEDHVKALVDTHPALAGDGGFQVARRAYMAERAGRNNIVR